MDPPMSQSVGTASNEDHSPPLSQMDSPISVNPNHLALISEFDPFAQDAKGNKAEEAEPDSMSAEAVNSGVTEQKEDIAESKNEGDTSSRPATPSSSTFANISAVFRRNRTGQEGTDSNRSSLEKTRSGRPPTPGSSRRKFEHTPTVIADEDEDVTASGESSFDFQGFLVQLRTKPAEPIQKYLKSFLVNFAKRPFTVNDQIKLIHDFLAFITQKMKQTEPWKSQTRVDFENAVEAMEKLVMNRLYTYTFTPMMDSSEYPVTTDDLERDGVLSQRIRLFGWVREKHLDVPEGEASQGFLAFAEQELLKINHYKAPRDKMICILNCCKVIYGLIRHQSGSEIASADQFLPILIYVVLRANPDNLLSNIEYIQRFRRPEKLEGEPAYYLFSLAGAVSFIETMDASGLSNITQEEFEENVESAIAELPPGSPERAKGSGSTVDAPLQNTAEGEEPARALTSLPINFAFQTRKFFQQTGETVSDAVARPISAIGKMLENMQMPGNEEDEREEGSANERDRLQTPVRGPRDGAAYQPRTRSPQPKRTYDVREGMSSGRSGRPEEFASPIPPWLAAQHQALAESPGGGGGGALLGQSSDRLLSFDGGNAHARAHLDFSAPASGTQTPSNDPTFNFNEVTAEIDRTHATARQAGVETLHQMFPTLDEEVAGMVLDGCNGDLGQAIDRMLEMA